MGGAVKAWLEGLGLGVAVYRDGAPVANLPDGTRGVAVALPFIVVQEGIGYTSDLHGDTDAAGSHLGVRELVQVDLYQTARTVAGGKAPNAEDYALADALMVAFARGAAAGLGAHAPWHIYGVKVDTGQRAPTTDNRTRHTWTLRVSRDTERMPA